MQRKRLTLVLSVVTTTVLGATLVYWLRVTAQDDQLLEMESLKSQDPTARDHAATEPASIGSVLPHRDNVSRPTTEPSLIPAPPDAAPMIAGMRKDGLDVPDDLMLPSESMWEDMLKAWNQQNHFVEAAMREKQKVGTSLAKKRFDSGQYTTARVADYDVPKPEDLLPSRRTKYVEKRPWMLFEEQGEWKSYMDNGTGVIKIVRIKPGEDSTLDTTTHQVLSALQSRKMTMMRFLDIAQAAKGVQRK